MYMYMYIGITCMCNTHAHVPTCTCTAHVHTDKTCATCTLFIHVLYTDKLVSDHMYSTVPNGGMKTPEEGKRNISDYTRKC